MYSKAICFQLEKELEVQTSLYKSYRLTNDKLHSWSINMLKRFDKVNDIELYICKRQSVPIGYKKRPRQPL